MLNDASRILNDTWMVSVCLNIEGFYFFAGRKWLTIRVDWSGRYEQVFWAKFTGDVLDAPLCWSYLPVQDTARGWPVGRPFLSYRT